MELEPMLATILRKLDPTIQPYVDERGKILVRLESIGFVANPVDQCVLNRTVNGKQCTITLHVDDLLVLSQDKRDTEWLVEQLDGVLEEAAVTGRAASPATSSLFAEGAGQKLGRKEAANFHSVVAKLLYLTTRVKGPTIGDQQKLNRVLKYLAHTRDQDLQLKIGEQLRVRSFIDASFATHEDGKGHTGVVVQLGGATVLCRSTKQRIVTKDSTESELVGLSDMMSVIYQDNLSNLSLVTKGGGKYRSKYLQERCWLMC